MNHYTHERLDKLAAMEPDALEEWFLNQATYHPSAPKHKYTLRLGVMLLKSDDTHDLRRQFERRVAARKRAIARWGKRPQEAP